MKNIVVSIKRDSYRWPKLTITVEARCKNKAAAQSFITHQVMSVYHKGPRGRAYPYINVKDYRIVDEVGLKRLLAAAKASVTIRRKRAARKAAVTRAKNKAARFARTAAARAVLAARRDVPAPSSLEFYPVAGDSSLN